MDIKSAKVCASPKIFLATCRGPFRGALQRKPSNILMHIKSAKTIALAQKKLFGSSPLSAVVPLSARPQLASYLY
jgi:hypothetical protein